MLDIVYLSLAGLESGTRDKGLSAHNIRECDSKLQEGNKARKERKPMQVIPRYHLYPYWMHTPKGAVEQRLRSIINCISDSHPG